MKCGRDKAEHDGARAGEEDPIHRGGGHRLRHFTTIRGGAEEAKGAARTAGGANVAACALVLCEVKASRVVARAAPKKNAGVGRSETVVDSRARAR